MTENGELAQLFAYFNRLSDEHKQEIIKQAETLVSAQKAEEQKMGKEEDQ
ncbi:MAG: hypothetical protein LBR26_09390 [Prevotella sp.]|jgi:hypothetical protein|nr:hypothetical protein [Prevotella sp.]